MIKYKISEEFLDNKEDILNIENNFKKNDISIHKARNELKVIKINLTQTIVKSFKIPNFLNKIIYSYFRESKAKRSYDYSIILKDFSPKPIAYIEFYKNKLLDNSYFISEKFDYDFTIREALKEKIQNKTKEDYIKIYEQFAYFTYNLHENNIFHDDYSPGNILIKELNGNYIFKIVDVNRMYFKKLDSNKRAKNFEKLWAKDYILEIMAKEYIKHYESKDDFIKEVLYYSNKNKKIKNFKKRLKGIPVVD